MFALTEHGHGEPHDRELKSSPQQDLPKLFAKAKVEGGRLAQDDDTRGSHHEHHEKWIFTT
jgi:hypothetical protein